MKKLFTLLLLVAGFTTGALATDVTLPGDGNYAAHDGDVLTGSTSGTVTIVHGAKITLSDVTINGGIVCEGTAEITLVGTNNVTAPDLKAGIQMGGEGTTLTIKGNGALTATGGQHGAGIGTGYTPGSTVSLGNIVIEGGTITASGGQNGAGIGTSFTINVSATLGDITVNGGMLTAIGAQNAAGIGTGYTPNGSASLGDIMINGGTLTATGGQHGAGIGTGYTVNGGSATLGNIIISGGTLKATGGLNGAGIGTGRSYDASASLGNITIYNTIDMVDASSFGKDVTYMHGASDVTANANDYFHIRTNGNRLVITDINTVVDGEELTGTISSTVKIADGAKVTLSDVTINSGIVCAGTAEITLVGTNIVTGPTDKAGIQVGGEGTTLTIKGDGSLTTTGGEDAAGIGTGYIPNSNVSLGNIVIEGGTITAIGGEDGAGIGTGFTPYGSSVSLGDIIINAGTVTATGGNEGAGIGTGYTPVASASLGDITINGGTVNATGGEDGAGIGTGYTPNSNVSLGNITISGGTVTATGGYDGAGIGTGFTPFGNVSLGNIVIEGGTITATGGYDGAGIGAGVTFDGGTCNIGAVIVFTGVERLDASSISKDITYMSGEYDVTANASDFFDITVNGSNYIIVTNNAVTLVDGMAYNWIYGPHVPSATYVKTLGEERVGKYQAWFVPFDYTITSADLEKFTFYKINMIANSPDPSQEATDDIWVFVKKLGTGDVLHANMPYVYKPLEAVTDYAFTTSPATMQAKNTGVIAKSETLEDIYSFYGTYENTIATPEDPFYYVNINGALSLGNDGTVTVGPYRWIMRVENKFGGSPAYARDVHFFDAEDDMTGISSMDDGQWTTDDKTVDIYNLAGQKLSTMQKGINIVNGKKVLK